MAKRGDGVIRGNKRDNVLEGTSGADRIEGRGGDDLLRGLAGSDTLLGGNGNDTLEGGAGGDRIVGGDGSDVAVFAGARDDYEVVDAGNGTILIVGADGTDTVLGVETFQFSDLTQSATEVLLPRLADLSVGTLTLDDASLAPGEGATVSFDLTSDGDVDAEASRYELIVATAPDAGAVVAVLDTGHAAALATGGAATYQAAVPAGALEPGTYWVAVRVDADDAVAESDEGDNLTEWVELVVEAPAADLRLDGATLAARTDLDLAGGGEIQMTYAYANAGNVTPSYFKIRTYLSTDETISDDDKSILGITGGTFTGQQGAATTSYYFQPDFPAGDYYLISEISWGDGSADATPEDNRIVQQVTFTPAPTDLAVNAVSVESWSDLVVDEDGARVDVGVQVANLGGVAAGTTVTAYLSADGAISADDVAVTGTLGSIYAGSAVTLDLAFVLDETFAPGDYTILVELGGGDANISNDFGQTFVTLEAPVPPPPPEPIIEGTEGADVLVGTMGNDTIAGLGGDDHILATEGSDVMDGGAGVDTVDFSGLTSGIDLYGDWFTGPGNLTVYVPATGASHAVTGVEAVVGTDHQDFVDLSATGISHVDLGAGDDAAYGDETDDVILAGAGADQVAGFMGDDTVTLGEGADMFGVSRWIAGDGTARTGHGNDVITDFDVAEDLLYFEVGIGDAFDPLADAVQEWNGTRIAYADDSSILLEGVDVSTLSAANVFVEEFGFTF